MSARVADLDIGEPTANPSVRRTREGWLRVRIEWYEVALAAQVGVARQLDSMRKGNRDHDGINTGGWTEHIEGAIGELVVAKLFRTFWLGSVGTYRSIPDVDRFEVRTRSKRSYQLAIRPDDHDDRSFILVRGRGFSLDVVGWIVARDAKRPEWSAEKVLQGERMSPRFFVPDEALRPMSELANDPVLREKVRRSVS